MNTLESKRVKAKKRHVCDYCGKIIESGEKYRYSKHEFDGTIYSWHSCDRCGDYVSECFENDYYNTDDGLSEDTFWEFMNEYHADVAAEWSEGKDK